MEGVGRVPARPHHSQQAERTKDLKAGDDRKRADPALKMLGLEAKVISPGDRPLKQSGAGAISSFPGYSIHMTDGVWTTMFSCLGLGREYWNERPLDSMLSSLVSHFMGVVLVRIFYG